MSFENLGLLPSLQKSVFAKGYTRPSLIQKKAIPFILQGKDVMGGAQTGTGKTAAFALPVLQILEKQNRRERRPRALVLAPTRELAAQVFDNFQEYGQHLHQRCQVVFGGVNINPQIDTLRRGVDILVACPGRLLDLAGRHSVDLSAVEILILDEADRMLDMGFIHDIRKVLNLLPQKRQNLLFSATYSPEIQKLAQKVLNDPVMVDASPRNKPAERVNQTVYTVAQNQKRHALAHLIKSEAWPQALVFTRTKHGANRLAGQLTKQGIDAEAIHGNKSQTARTKSLARFKENEIRVLVATDIAARGIDINELPHVVNFDLPNVPEDYIHRIGRTGRAGAIGNAVSLVADAERNLLNPIERLLGRRIPRKIIDGFVAASIEDDPADHSDMLRPNYHAPRNNASAGDRDNAIARPQRRRFRPRRRNNTPTRTSAA
ncbi:MAG: DEAD/DEAH box helicase [Deltaproteobacteria bacterium]|nr:DEAD/DEAH box helicase [Deltaproteobacteria bacterium]